jgi:hypothetical protein
MERVVDIRSMIRFTMPVMERLLRDPNRDTSLLQPPSRILGLEGKEDS